MSKLITNNLKLFNVENFIESFTEPGFNIYYFFVGNPRPFSSDTTPPVLYDNVQTTSMDAYDNMIYGKRITANDVVAMCPRHDWESGLVYTKYSHDSNSLFESAFYVMSDEGSSYSVFKCLDNAGGAVSTEQPLSTSTEADDDFYFTSDGYQWKYMYSVTPSQYNKFATQSHLPVFVNANVVGNSASGSIDNIQVVSPGSAYASYSNGSLQEVRVGGNPLVYAIESTASSNSNFYVNSALKITSGSGSGQQRIITGYTVTGSARRVYIDSPFDASGLPTTASTYEITPLVTVSGDGSGAKARAIVNAASNTIYKIEIVNRGVDYTYATVAITGNTGIVNVSTGTAITANTATAKVIISPKGGHGSNAAAELGGKYAGISVQFDSTLSGNKVVDENDFRSVGVIKDPAFANVVLSITGSTGTFSDNEEITQGSGAAIAGIVVTSPGSGYTANAVVTITGTSSNSATAVAVANSSGRISSIPLTVGGAGYVIPSVTISAPAAYSFNSYTDTSTPDDFITVTDNRFQNNDYVKYLVATGNTVISGLANNTSYYVVSANSTGVKLSSTLNGSAINITAGSSPGETGHSLTGQTAIATAVLSTERTITARGTVYAANDSVVKLTNAYGFFVVGNSSVSLLYGNTTEYTAECTSVTQPTTYFDQTYKVVATLQTAQDFVEDEIVTQSENATGYFYSSNSTVVRLVDKRGTINQSDISTNYYIDGSTSTAKSLVSGIIPADLIHGSGDVIYIENFTPITKTGGQTETVKLVLEF